MRKVNAKFLSRVRNLGNLLVIPSTHKVPFDGEKATPESREQNREWRGDTGSFSGLVFDFNKFSNIWEEQNCLMKTFPVSTLHGEECLLNLNFLPFFPGNSLALRT